MSLEDIVILLTLSFLFSCLALTIYEGYFRIKEPFKPFTFRTYMEAHLAVPTIVHGILAVGGLIFVILGFGNFAVGIPFAFIVITAPPTMCFVGMEINKYNMRKKLYYEVLGTVQNYYPNFSNDENLKREIYMAVEVEDIEDIGIEKEGRHDAWRQRTIDIACKICKKYCA